MTTTQLSADIIAKLIHAQLTNADPAVTAALRNLFLSDAVDMTKDEFLDNFGYAQFQAPGKNEFLEATNTPEFYKAKAIDYAKELMVMQWADVEKSIEEAQVEVSSTVQSNLRVHLTARP